VPAARTLRLLFPDSPMCDNGPLLLCANGAEARKNAQRRSRQHEGRFFSLHSNFRALCDERTAALQQAGDAWAQWREFIVNKRDAPLLEIEHEDRNPLAGAMQKALFALPLQPFSVSTCIRTRITIARCQR
jgi:hypothetical protein